MIDSGQQLMTLSLGEQLLSLTDEFGPDAFTLVVEATTAIADTLGHVSLLADRGGWRSHHLVSLAFINHRFRLRSVSVVQALDQSAFLSCSLFLLDRVEVTTRDEQSAEMASSIAHG